MLEEDCHVGYIHVIFYYELQAEHGVNCSKFCFVCGVYLDQMTTMAILMAERSVLKKCNILEEEYLSSNLFYPTNFIYLTLLIFSKLHQ